MQAGTWNERNQPTRKTLSMDRHETRGHPNASAPARVDASLEYNPPSREVVKRLINWLEEPGE